MGFLRRGRRLGTTTLVAALLDLATGRQVRVASRLNPQTRFGDDVLTRILMARTSSDGLEQLQRVVVEAIDEMIGELCDATGIAAAASLQRDPGRQHDDAATVLRHRSRAAWAKCPSCPRSNKG